MHTSTRGAPFHSKLSSLKRACCIPLLNLEASLEARRNEPPHVLSYDIEAAPFSR